MPAPFIKIYQLPPGYTEAGDSDIQQTTNDELLPVVDRSQLLPDAVTLTGIVPYMSSPLQPVNLGAGRANYTLGPSGGSVQTPTGISIGNILDVRGYLGVKVYTSGNVLIDEAYWTFDEDGFHFVSGHAPSGGYVSCYQKHSTPHTSWALASNTPYEGNNPSFNTILVKVDGGALALASVADVNKSYITTASASEVLATYATTKAKTKWFIGEYENWVTNHLRMNPDVFVGEIDYPGDATEVDDTPYEPGVLPKYRELGTYTLDARRGMVAFPEDIDSDDLTVKALYAHLDRIQNVTGQRLTVIGGTGGLHFKATSETAFPGSHGKRWVRQNRETLPLNIYVNGDPVPTITSVAPFDELTVITN